MPTFVKQRRDAPAGFFACEAAGLQWLSASKGGVPCARVIEHDDVSLALERLDAAAPTRNAASEFGRRLARTHDASADSFGSPPGGWTGPGYEKDADEKDADDKKADEKEADEPTGPRHAKPDTDDEPSAQEPAKQTTPKHAKADDDSKADADNAGSTEKAAA